MGTTDAVATTDPAGPPHWELAAEAISVRIRWFGLVLGYAYANLATAPGQAAILNLILAPGLVFTTLDSLWSARGRVLFDRWPLVVSAMEALFIGLLCFFESGLDSPFRFYYLLSLICCAIRFSARVTYATFVLHCLSFVSLYLALAPTERRPLAFLLNLVILGWVVWACAAFSHVLKGFGEHLARLNAALRREQQSLEARITERTRQLQESQAHVRHQEKMAAFGLLAAGIAHEVGNPLTGISSVVQMLRRRDCDDYTRERLALVDGQLQRIRTTLRELVNFSRPASHERTRFSPADALNEALGIAKYYKGFKSRTLTVDVPAGLPTLHGVRDQLVQAFLNLILNALDATEKAGRVEVSAVADGGDVVVRVRDDGRGVSPEHASRLFTPYFTTRKDGTGLGLFVTRQLVADHGGTVTFTSEPGAGTTFEVRLPADRPAR